MLPRFSLMSIAPLLYAVGLGAAPAMAQVSAVPLPPPAGANYSNAPVERAMPGAPPAPAAPAVSTAYAAPPVAGPQPGGMQRAQWLAECERRLNATAGADVTLSPGACQSWWAYYQGGGAPHPTYGYAIPISVTETVTPDCPPQTIVEKRVIKRRVIRRKPMHDKRIAI